MTPALLASPSVVADAFRREYFQALEECAIHHATCRARRQRLVCSTCAQVERRAWESRARLLKAENRERAAGKAGR